MTEFSLEMLRQALVHHKAWAAAGWLVPVSVNIGPGCVADPDFPAAVSRLLAEEQVPGQMIALEVSEETGTTAVSARFFAQLAESGIQFSLDDFGTGFASLESLGGWPINELKLDSSIVRPIISSRSFRTIVRTTIDLAHQLGVKVVGEGVESAAISSELQALGCDIGQGFYLGRPMPAARLHRVAPRPGQARAAHGSVRLPAAQSSSAPGGSRRTAQRVHQPRGRRPAASGAAGRRGRGGDRGTGAARLRHVADVPLGRARAPGAHRRPGVRPVERGRGGAGLAGVAAGGSRVPHLPRVAPAVGGDAPVPGRRPAAVLDRERDAPGGLPRLVRRGLPRLLCRRLLRPGLLPRPTGVGPGAAPAAARPGDGVHRRGGADLVPGARPGREVGPALRPVRARHLRLPGR